MNLSPLPIQKFFDNNGNPLNGGLLFTYVAGTTTKIATYTNSTGGTPNTNPVVLDYRGEANVWLDPSLTYKFTLAPVGDTDPPTKPIWTVDQISSGITLAQLTQQIIGQILYPRTAAEIAAGVTPVFYYYAQPDIRRYGADETGVADSTTALRNGLLANKYAFLPAGLFTISSTIVITGAPSIIVGAQGGGRDGQISRINWTGTGALFSATGAEFGSIYIGHLNIDGGSADGVACIVSERPQSVFEWLNIGPGANGYDNPGIRLQPGAGFDRSWDTAIRHCKYVGPANGTTHQHNAYRGYYIEIGGGFCEFADNSAIFGSAGLEIHQGQAIRVNRFITNRQNATYSSETATNGQMGIKLSGALGVNTRYKPACSIVGCYIEANTNGIYVESCESLTISDNYIADIGEGSSPGITLVNGDCQNVSIRNNQILQSLAAATAISNASANKVLVINNNIDASGAGGKWLTATARTDYGWNRIINGVLSDVSSLTINVEPVRSAFTGTLTGCTTAPTASFKYNITGGIATVLMTSLTAVSNTVACTITGVPAELIPLTLKRVVCRISDNSVVAFGLIQIDPATPGTFTLGVGATFAAFTNVNNKGVSNTEITYGLE